MKEKDKKFIRNWGKTRKRGRFRYALLVGLIWGIVVSIGTNLFDLRDSTLKEEFFSTSFLKDTLLFIIVGVLLFSQFMWIMQENKFKGLIIKQTNESNS